MNGLWFQHSFFQLGEQEDKLLLLSKAFSSHCAPSFCWVTLYLLPPCFWSSWGGENFLPSVSLGPRLRGCAEPSWQREAHGALCSTNSPAPLWGLSAHTSLKPTAVWNPVKTVSSSEHRLTQTTQNICQKVLRTSTGVELNLQWPHPADTTSAPTPRVASPPSNTLQDASVKENIFNLFI